MLLKADLSISVNQKVYNIEKSPIFTLLNYQQNNHFFVLTLRCLRQNVKL